MTPSERSLRARLAAHALHAQHDSSEVSKAGREAFLARFEREVDPEGTLPTDERIRRAAHARKAYFTRLALKSAQARRHRMSAGTETPSTPGLDSTDPA